MPGKLIGYSSRSEKGIVGQLPFWRQSVDCFDILAQHIRAQGASRSIHVVLFTDGFLAPLLLLKTVSPSTSTVNS
jgi:hypothetical protein